MHPLYQRISALRARLRRLVVEYGLGRVVAVGMAAVLVLGGMDYLIRFRDPGLRVISSLVAMGVIGWAGYRYLYRGLTARLRDVDLALRVQRRFPQLDDRLLSAMEFLDQAEDDPTAGSAALRRAVIVEATSQTADVDFADVLDRRPARRALAAAAIVGLLAAVLAVWNPPACRIALARLVNPLSETAWPRQTHLELRRWVTQVARGQAFEVEAVDAQGARLPADVRIHYRFLGADGVPIVETERMRPLDNALVARRENVTRPFSYRVEGGDDQTLPWIDVAVVEPPVIQSLAIRLVPPEYTGWPVYQSGKQVRALVGTRMEITASAGKPLAQAVLCLEDGRRIVGQLLDEHRFRVPAEGARPLVIEKSQTYWFALTDREGLTGEDLDRGEIHAVPDAPPSVIIQQPQGSLFVTAQAAVPLQIEIKDDLAIRDVALVIQRSDRPQQEPARAVIYAGPQRVPPQPVAAVVTGTLPGESMPIDYRWDLAPLGLRPGSEVTFQAAASDYRPATGQSEPRRLHVITADEMQDRIAGRQGLILAELARILKMQQESRQQAGVLAVQGREPAGLKQIDVDHLQAAALGQRQVDRALADHSEGLPMHIAGLLADLTNNRLQNADVQRHMEEILAEIARLEREHLPAIAHGLTDAIKAAQIAIQRQQGAEGASARDPAIADSLDAAVTHQDHVIASLQRLLAQLGQWDNFRRFHREIGQLLREQEETTRRTADMARGTLSRELKDLLPQQLADLRVLGRGQLKLALGLEQLQEEMREAAVQLRAGDAKAARTLAEALESAQRQAIAAEMRAARNNVERNQMGQAAAGQRQVAEGLREVLAILAGRSAGGPGRLDEAVKNLHQQQGRLLDETQGLESLRQAQGGLSDAQQQRLQDLTGQQGSLASETGQLGQQQGRAGALGLALRGAAADMARAAEQLKTGRSGDDVQQAQRDALHRLSLLHDALRPETGGSATGGTTGGDGAGQGGRRGSRNALAELKLLRLMQDEVNQRTQGLEKTHGKLPPMDEPARQQYHRLSEEQGRLAELVAELLRQEAEEEPR